MDRSQCGLVVATETSDGLTSTNPLRKVVQGVRCVLLRARHVRGVAEPVVVEGQRIRNLPRQDKRRPELTILLAAITTAPSRQASGQTGGRAHGRTEGPAEGTADSTDEPPVGQLASHGGRQAGR